MMRKYHVRFDGGPMEKDRWTVCSPAPRQRPTQHILTDRSVVHALEDAADRGVDVRILLEPHPFGEGDVSAARTLEELRAAGVQARQADQAYHYTHEKALVVDHATA
jgi:phosphatidylserine/phosphatidylglycerophosphate/cardiolipin synthase-like enzyme